MLVQFFGELQGICFNFHRFDEAFGLKPVLLEDMFAGANKDALFEF